MNQKKTLESLRNLFERDTTTEQEKEAILYAINCISKIQAKKVKTTEDFMKLLYDHMGFDYDVVENKEADKTILKVSTFYKK